MTTIDRITAVIQADTSLEPEIACVLVRILTLAINAAYAQANQH